MKKFYLLIILISSFIHSQEKDSIKTQIKVINAETSHLYEKPKFLDIFTKLPKDFASMGNSFIQKENLLWFGASVAATGALIPFDQQLIDESNRIREDLGWPDGHKYDKLGPLKIIPKSTPAFIYYVGNGGTVVLGSLSLLTYGAFTNDYRAYRTSAQLIEGIFAAGLVTTVIKRITGRESPFIAMENGNPGGDWNPFPSFSAYQKNTPNYDAMPSGHTALFVTSLVILSENYPEYKWIKPAGYSFLGVLMFEMMATNVHWASDYPLAVFLGYMIGKNIAKNGFKKINTKETSFRSKLDWNLTTSMSPLGYQSVGVNVKF